MTPMATTKTKVPLSAAIREYQDLQRARAHSNSTATEDGDRVVLGMFLRHIKDRQCGGITADHVESFFYGPGGLRDHHKTMSRRAKTLPPVSERTHNHYRSRLKTFVTWAVTKGYMKPGLVAESFDPRMGAVRPLKVARAQRQRPAPMTLLALLDKTPNPRDRCYLAVAVNTGLRASEIRGMTVGQVDLDGGYLVGVVIQKTGDNDDLPISLDLDRELRVWLMEYEAELGRPLRNEDHLFPRRYGGMLLGSEITEDGDRVQVRAPYYLKPDQPIRETHLIVQKALRALGLPTAKEGTHTIRRAVALAYFQEVSKEQGDVAALRETAAFLHHASVVTTEIYLGMTPEKNRRNARLQGKPFLSAMVEADNVIPLRPRAEGE